MSNHTPAPWRVDRGSMLDGVNVITPRNEWICYLGMASRPDAVADANLIAAAPELLKSLDDMCQRLEQIQYDHNTCDGDLVLEEARAAIAKAKGEI